MKLRDLLILAGGVAVASQASALSLGNSQGGVQLGSPLDLVFQVHADAGQSAQSSCLSADIWMGDTPLGSSQVLLEAQDKSVRIRTTSPVYEPLVTLKLSAGCAGAVSRSYTFFADPPSTMAASVQPIDLSKIQLSALPAAPRTSAPAVKSAPSARAAKRSIKPKALKQQTGATATATTAAAPAALAALAETPNASASTTPIEAPPTSNTDVEASKPRLRIEPLEGLDSSHSTAVPVASGDSEAAASTASAALDEQTQLLLTTNASRLESLEQQLQTLQQQLRRNHTEMSGLQTQLTQAQHPDLPIWVHLMLGLLALALATIAWLIQRIKQERIHAHRSWADTVLAVEDSERATTIDTRANAASTPLAPAESAPITGAGEAAATAALQNHEQTSAPPAPAVDEPQSHALYQEFELLKSGTAPPAEATSIAEVLTAQALFDVQEQAEFYASIGENDQAIAVLQTHIAENEASSPLAYIELLQLLYRLSRTEAYQAVREQFQTHFNVQVPDFLGFSRKGRDLWSGHPDVLSQIEAHWPADDVQNLLRGLILRRNTVGIAASPVRFDLAAFDDLLMLYNVAKTTPASSRGQLPGRTRTVPMEVPLPEVVLESAADAPVASYQPPARDTTPTNPPLPLADAYLDLLSAAPAQAPLAPPVPHTDSPFHTPSHFAPNEALMDGLSLDWENPQPVPTLAPSSHEDVKSPALDDLDVQLQAFMMDERDLPKDPRA